MKYFLYDSETGESISSSEAQPTSLLQALAIFSRLEFDNDTFFGLTRNDGRILQFAGENDGQILLVDMPMVTKNGSLQLRTVQEAGQELIQEFFEGKSLEETHKFEFYKW
jgi:hypothetical protein